MTDRSSAQIIVIGNEKGGSGKSTTAMHVLFGLLWAGQRVASIDLDVRQRTLSRFIENRTTFCGESGMALPMPEHHTLDASEDNDRAAAAQQDRDNLAALIGNLRGRFDAVVIDTPGSDSVLNRAAHEAADTLVTPLNDSLVDLDVISRVAAQGRRARLGRPSHYAEMVWEQKLRRAQRGARALDWIVMRNRLSSLDAVNKRTVERLLGELAGRFGFRVVSGFGERVIFRELFPRGLTLMDLGKARGSGELSMSQVAARQEVRGIVSALRPEAFSGMG